MIPEVGIGLVGYGGIGRLHALCYRMLPLAYPDLPVNARLVAVATASAASAERARRELGAVVATTSFEELISRDDVTVVDCCTPTGDHMQVATAALAAGKALFCEKPLATTSVEASVIAELARKHGLTGAVNFHFRYVPAIQEARRRVDAGLLGTIYSFHLRYYHSSNLKRERPLTWRFVGPGSGVLFDLGSHLIDLVLHLLGPIVAVGARTRTMIAERPGPDGQLSPVESDDVVWLQVELADGGIGTIEASKVVPGAGDDLRVEVYGSQGALVFDTRDPNGLQIVEGANGAIGGRRIATLSNITPAASIPREYTPTSTIHWHLASIAAFLDALSAGKPAQPDLENSVRVQEVIDAALRSAAQNGTPITIARAQT